MNFKESFISVFTNWKNFSGRACRSEYWYFYLFASIVTFSLTIIETILAVKNEGSVYGLLSTSFQIIIIIPYISVTSRRLQDRGISGWWQLSYFTIIGILVIFVLLIFPAREDENNWGRNPLLET